MRPQLEKTSSAYKNSQRDYIINYIREKIQEVSVMIENRQEKLKNSNDLLNAMLVGVKTQMKMASVIALALVLVSVPAFASVTETVTGGYTVGTKNYDLIKGVFYFPSAVAIDDALIDIPARFFYTDGFFAEDPYTYNNHLATASICMAMSAFYSNEGDYPTKRKNITQ